MTEYLPILLELAKNFPWILATLALCYGIYRVIIYLGNYLFHSETGQVTLLLQEQRDFISSVKNTNISISNKLSDTDNEVKKIDDKLSGLENDVDVIKQDVNYIKGKIS